MSMRTMDGGLSRRSVLKRGGALAGGAALLGATRALNNDVLAAESSFKVEVACDGLTFTINRSAGVAADTPARRGDTFVVQGRMFPSGTIDQGLSGPGQAGSIGTWVCRGVFQFGTLEIMAGAVPHVLTTQFFLFDSGDGLVTDGFEGGTYTLRAITGGYGRYMHARGQQHQHEVGVNETLIDLGTLVPDDGAEPQRLLVPAPNIAFEFDFAS